jgi:AcrR family transcriptional regulator
MTTDRLRRQGRPDQQGSEEIFQHILETAARLFVEQGYAATSIEQVAAAAGSGKQTIYRRFTSKEGLFMAVIDSRCEALLAAARAAETEATDPLAALKATCRTLLDFALLPEKIDFARVLVAELRRFPELADYATRSGLEPFEDLMKRLLDAAIARGQLRDDDDGQMLHALLGLVTGWPFQKALFGRSMFAGEAERSAYFEGAWRIFIDGVGRPSAG